MEEGYSAETRIDPLHDHDAFSFTRSAEKLRQVWKTSFEDHSVRLPLKEDFEEDNALVGVEQRAHIALGLEAGEPFIVIVRVWSHDDEPQMIERVYLHPDKFPTSFLQDHDFAHESLVHLYEKYGYLPRSRNTTLTARAANIYETNELRVPLRKPVLVAEQEVFAENSKIGDLFLLEYSEATYVDWSYRIESRPALSTENSKQWN